MARKNIDIKSVKACPPNEVTQGICTWEGSPWCGGRVV